MSKSQKSSKVKIRPFQESDIPHLIKILKLNGQYVYPEIEGPEPMKRVAKCRAAVFLVAVKEDKPCGLIRAIYDGSRALIHLLSVHPKYQYQGIGSALLEAVGTELLGRGAPTVSVTVTKQSVSFWRKRGFEKLPVFLMLKKLKRCSEKLTDLTPTQQKYMGRE